MFRMKEIGDSVSGPPNLSQRGHKDMHTALVASTFLLMVLSPCLVAMRSGAADDTQE